MSFNAEFNLADLNGQNGFVLKPEGNDESFGAAVSRIGDINGDGIDDVIVGAPSGGPPAIDQPFESDSTAGKSYVVFGREGDINSPLELADLDGSNGFVIIGDGNAVTTSGFTVSEAGDVNGDGADDFIVGAIGAGGEGNYTGQSYVVFGSTSGFSRELNLAELDGSNGFATRGVTGGEFGDFYGSAVSGAGDFNGDGFDDLIVGAAYAGSIPASITPGESYLIFGSASGFDSRLDLSSLDGTDGFSINGGVDDNLGISVSGLDDINGDGFDDIILGAPSDESLGYDNEPGKSYVVFGAASGFGNNLNLESLDGSNGFVVRDPGEAPEGQLSVELLGSNVGSAGDINNDGLGDFIVDGNFVVFGSTAGFDSTFELSSLDGSNGFLIDGGNSFSLRNGSEASGVGDINGDGIDDLIVNRDDFLDNSASFVIFGSETGFDSRFELSSLDGSNGFIVNQIEGGFPGSADGAGDVNNDGIDDLILGSSSAGDGGESYVVFGQASDLEPPVPQVPGPETSNELNPVSGGTAGDDGITGTAEGDFIQGLAGNDALSGGAEGDFLDGGDGIDTVVYQFDPAGVTVDLAAGFAVDGSGKADGLFNIENVLGSDFADDIKGDDGANSLTGRAGNDVIEGGLGDDTLLGGTGADELIGGAGADNYLYTSAEEGGDTIVGFEVGSDKLLLIGAAFGGLASGELSAEQFFVGTEATLGNSRIGYRTDTGEVLFDADGAGGSDAQVLATLSATPGFSNADVVVL